MKRDYVPSLIGKSGAKAAELRDKFKVRISFARRQPPHPRAQAPDAGSNAHDTTAQQQSVAPDASAVVPETAEVEAKTNSAVESVPLANGHDDQTPAPAPTAAATEAVAESASSEAEKAEHQEPEPVPESEKPVDTAQPSQEATVEKQPAEPKAAPSASSLNWADEMEREQEEQLEEVVIVGYKDHADACRAEIERLVALAAAHTTEDLFIDESVHRRLIGTRTMKSNRRMYIYLGIYE